MQFSGEKVITLIKQNDQYITKMAKQETPVFFYLHTKINNIWPPKYQNTLHLEISGVHFKNLSNTKLTLGR